MKAFKDKYSIPEPVEIQLEDVTFTVRLPTSANRVYERAIATGSSEVTKDGEVISKKLTLSEMVEIQHRAFLDVCVLKMNGDDFDKESLYADYPGAIEDLNTKAREMVEDLEEVAQAEVGKSRPSSTGPQNGQDKVKPTDSLRKQAG